jgi:predicted SprT family Zn-dependent metalloprotease
MDRTVSCKKCPKTFKLNFHLQRHELSCTGFKSYITCSVCGDFFKSERTLKNHKLKCQRVKLYNCHVCAKKFKDYGPLKKHRETEHRKIECEICKSEIYFKNMKRHMKQVHMSEMPATAARQKRKKEKTTKFQCDNCQECFFDKSTLNRHKKNHLYPCEHCENTFQNIAGLSNHKVMHRKTTEQNNIEGKAILTTENLSLVLDLHKHIEGLLLTVTNRGQALELTEMKNYVEKIVKKNVSDEILRATLSMHPEAYSLYVLNNVVYIEIVSSSRKIDPKILEERRKLFKNKIRALHQNDMLVVNLIDIPKTKSVMYKSALDIINENIVHFSESEEEDLNDNPQTEELSRFDKLSEKIKKKQLRKLKEKKKINEIDWQKHRLPDLARKTNSLFIRENKSVLNINTIYRNLNTSTKEINSDFQRLVRSSKGWLTDRNGWIRKKAMDINIICSDLV